jgi:hypothetical protein
MIIYFRRGCVFANRQNVLIILLRLTRSILTSNSELNFCSVKTMKKFSDGLGAFSDFILSFAG